MPKSNVVDKSREQDNCSPVKEEHNFEIVFEASQSILLDRLSLVIHNSSYETDQEYQDTEKSTEGHKNDVDTAVTTHCVINKVVAVFTSIN